MKTELSKYWKALIAGAGAVTTALVTLSTDPDVQAALPADWSQGLAIAAGVVGTGFLGWLVRNRMTVEQIDKALQAGDLTLPDLEKLVEEFKSK